MELANWREVLWSFVVAAGVSIIVKAGQRLDLELPHLLNGLEKEAQSSKERQSRLYAKEFQVFWHKHWSKCESISYGDRP